MYPIFKPAVVIGILSTLLYASTTMADAIVRSQAMFADTIAEYFVYDAAYSDSIPGMSARKPTRSAS